MTAEEYVSHMPGFIREKVRELIKNNTPAEDQDIFWAEAVSMYRKAHEKDPRRYPM